MADHIGYEIAPPKIEKSKVTKIEKPPRTIKVPKSAMNNPIHVGFVPVDFRSSRGDNAKETDHHSRNFERFFRDRGSRLQRSDEF